jgi:hypothetical protein
MVKLLKALLTLCTFKLFYRACSSFTMLIHYVKFMIMNIFTSLLKVQRLYSIKGNEDYAR